MCVRGITRSLFMWVLVSSGQLHPLPFYCRYQRGCKLLILAFLVTSVATITSFKPDVKMGRSLGLWQRVKPDLISMCQRCSSSLCLFSTAFCFCFFSLLSWSFLARLLGLISTGSSGFTFFCRKTEVGRANEDRHRFFYCQISYLNLQSIIVILGW